MSYERRINVGLRHTNMDELTSKANDLCINREVRREERWPLSRRGLEPVKLSHDKPVCQQPS